MVNYDSRHPEKLYSDVVEYFNGKINSIFTNYTCLFFKDDQNKIKQYLENRDNYCLSYIRANILMNIEFEGKNKWLVTIGYCETLHRLYPLTLLYDKKNHLYKSPECLDEDILKKVLDFLLWNDNTRKVCNFCGDDAVYNCEKCDNVDLCEKCQQLCYTKKLTVENLIVKKLTDDQKEGLCDICGKKEPDYLNDKKYFYLCTDCYANNTHKNHELQKIEKKSNLFNDEEVIMILKKTYYYYFATKILKKCNKSEKWKPLEKNNMCQIFNCEHPTIVSLVKSQNIKDDTLKELKKIELEFSELFDKMVRKFFVYNIDDYDYIFRASHNIILFCSDEVCENFYNNGTKMIDDKKNNPELDNDSNDDFILL